MTRRIKMTDEEIAEEYADKNKIYIDFDNDITDYSNVKEAYLAGLKVGREAEREYVKNNAFTSMKEQGLFPFGKWHKVADGDLPKENKKYLVLTSNGEPEVDSWLNISWVYSYDVIAWKEIMLPKEIKNDII